MTRAITRNLQVTHLEEALQLNIGGLYSLGVANVRGLLLYSLTGSRIRRALHAVARAWNQPTTTIDRLIQLFTCDWYYLDKWVGCNLNHWIVCEEKILKKATK